MFQSVGCMLVYLVFLGEFLKFLFCFIVDYFILRDYIQDVLLLQLWLFIFSIDVNGLEEVIGEIVCVIWKDIGDQMVLEDVMY